MSGQRWSSGESEQCPGQPGRVFIVSHFGVRSAVPAHSAAELPTLSESHLLTAAPAVLRLGECLALPGMEWAAKPSPSPTSSLSFVPPADFTAAKLLLADSCLSLQGQPAQEGVQVKVLAAGGSKLLGPNFCSLVWSLAMC